MYDNYRNIYQTARKTAGLTQERAAEALGICVESIRAYEQGLRVPSDEVVSRMVDLYDNRFLAVQHLRANAELARRIIPEMAEMPLSEAIMQLLSQIYAFADKHRDKDLLSIGADGRIDDEERPLYDKILSEVEGLGKAAMALRYAQEHA